MSDPRPSAEIASDMAVSRPGPVPAAQSRDVLDLAVVQPPRFVIQDGAIVWQGKEVVLRPQQAQILGVLSKFTGHFVQKDRMAMAIWPAQLPVDPHGQLRVQIRNLRHRMAGLPVRIESRWGYGYRLAGELVVE